MLQQLNRWIRRSVRRYLGIDGMINAQLDAAESAKLAESRHRELKDVLDRHLRAGVETHFKGNTTIILVSKLDGGCVEVVDFHTKDIRQVREVLLGLTKWAEPEIILDAPRHITRALNHELRRG